MHTHTRPLAIAFLTAALASLPACTGPLSTQDDAEATSADLSKPKEWRIATCMDFVLIAIATKSETKVAVRKPPGGDNLQLFGGFKSPTIKSEDGRGIGDGQTWQLGVEGSLQFGRDGDTFQYAYTEGEESDSDGVIKHGDAESHMESMRCTFDYKAMQRVWPHILVVAAKPNLPTGQPPNNALPGRARAPTSPPSSSSSTRKYCCKGENKYAYRFEYQYCGASGYGVCGAYSSKYEQVCEYRNARDCP